MKSKKTNDKNMQELTQEKAGVVIPPSTVEGKDGLTILDCRRIEQVVNSYLGFCKGKRTYNRRKDIIGKMGDKFFKYFYIRGHYESIRAKRKYREIVLPFEMAA